jgi:predicted NBD/HSP70 family sugar kinase
MINLLSPEEIIISGEGVRAGEHLFAPMRESIAKHVMPGLAQDTETRIDVWEDDAWARGAASLVLQELFKSPLHEEKVPRSA